MLQELVHRKFGFGMEETCQSFCSTSDLLLATHNEGRPLNYKSNPIPETSSLMDLPLDKDSAELVVTSEVQNALAIDLHTHLLPASKYALQLGTDLV